MPPPPKRSLKRFRPHVPLSKRKRIAQACISCRNGKKKCVLTTANQCRNCAVAGQICTFQPIAKQPEDASSQSLPESSMLVSIRPVSIEYKYLRGLQHKSPFADILTYSPDWTTIAANVSRRFRESFPEAKIDADQFSTISQLFQEAVYERRHELVAEAGSKGGQPFTSSHQIPQPIAVNEPLPTSSWREAVFKTTSPTSHASFLEAISDTIPPARDRRHDNSVQSGSLASKDTALVICAVLDHLPPYEHVEVLVDAFFTFVESNWYYFDEIWFRDYLASIYRGNAAALPQPKQCTIICLVFLVLALGSSFMHLSKSPRLDTADHATPGSLFFTQAMKLIEKVIAANNLESTICCLLISLYLLSIDGISHHRIYLGLALNLAVGQSLHREGIRKGEMPRDREMRVRLFWTIYSIERQTSYITGLPMILRLDDVTVSLPQRREDLDKDGFYRVDRLVVYTKMIMASDSITAASPIEQSSATYEWACSKLAVSEQLLAAHLAISQESPSSFRSNAHLSILYNMVWVTIGRGALLRLVRRRLSPSAADMRSLGDDDTGLRSQELARRCTEAASTIIDWIVQLQSRCLLAKFSFMDLHTCSLAAIVLLLNAFLCPADHQLSVVSRGIAALRFMADDSILALDALRLVERLQQGIYQATGMVNEESIPRQQSSSMSIADRPSAHDDMLGVGRGVLFVAPPNDGDGDSAARVNSLDLDLFTDLEPLFLEHSEQSLNLFGFDGFGSAFDLDSFNLNME